MKRPLEKAVHCSEDAIERYVLDTMSAVELGIFETHLVACSLCQESILELDLLLHALNRSVEPTKDDATAKQAASPKRREFVVEIKRTTQSPALKIGVLVLDIESNRLDYRFRRDLPELDDVRGESLQQFTSDIKSRAKELGGEKCVTWLQHEHRGPVHLAISEWFSTGDCTPINKLYTRHVHPMILPFRTHLPQYSIEAAAGNFGKQMRISPEGWVEVQSGIQLTEQMFVVHVKGHSMEPVIPDASLCAFRAHIPGSYDGKILLIEYRCESGGNRYTIKRCHLDKTAEPLLPGDERITLESVNPAYRSRVLLTTRNIKAVGEFLFVV